MQRRKTKLHLRASRRASPQPCPRLRLRLLTAWGFVLVTILSLIRLGLLLLEPYTFRAAIRSDADRLIDQVCANYGADALCAQGNPNKRHVAAVQYVESKQNGLGSQVLRMVDAGVVAYALGAPLELPEGARYWNYGCGPHRGWRCYFVAPKSYTRNCVQMHKWHPAQHDCVSIRGGASLGMAHDIHARMAGGDVRLAREAAARIWTLNGQTRSEVSKIHAHVPVLRGRYIGAHVRRGDKIREVRPVSLKRYAHAIRCIHPTLPVFVASDEGTSIIRLRAMLAPRPVFALPRAEGRRGHYQREANRRYLKRNRGVVSELLAEIEALRGATWFVGTFSSNLGRLVHVLRNAPPNTSVSLDDRWAPGVAWRTFGSAYCGSRDANKRICKCMSKFA